MKYMYCTGSIIQGYPTSYDIKEISTLSYIHNNFKEINWTPMKFQVYPISHIGEAFRGLYDKETNRMYKINAFPRKEGVI
jgi:hypothetical protein